MNNRRDPVAVGLRDVVKEYRETGGELVTAVDHVSLEIRDGEFFSLLGPSGCGKTTTLRMIAGLDLPTHGSITIHGVEMGQRPPFQRPVNTVFQRYALFPHMSVADNIAFGLRMRKVEGREIQRRVQEALDLVRLGNLGKRLPKQLSGGQQQRVALARALVNRPEVLLLDEPLGALDLKLRQAMQQELKRIQSQVGITFIYVTHDQEEALSMSDRIAVMNEGQVLQVGRPYDIYEDPATRFVADFIGESNFLDGVILENDALMAHVRLTNGEMSHVEHDGNLLAPGSRVTIAIRPEKVYLGVGEPPAERNVYAVTVQDVVYLGTDTYYDVSLAGDVTMTARQQNEDYTGTAAVVAPGDRAYVAWHAHNGSLLTA